MNRKIKLIWDFYGKDAKKTALHHEIHLRDYAEVESLQDPYFTVEEVNLNHWVATMQVEESVVFEVRDALKPHRGEVV